MGSSLYDPVTYFRVFCSVLVLQRNYIRKLKKVKALNRFHNPISVFFAERRFMRMTNDLRLRKRQAGHIRYLWMIFCGRINIKKIIRQNPERKLVLSDRGVGDRVFMLAYLKKWAEYYHFENWAILAINTKDPLYKSFSIEESRLIKITVKQYLQINLFCDSIFGRRFRKRHSEVFTANPFSYFSGTWILENPCIFDFASLTKAVYRIPQDMKPAECVGSEMEKLLYSLHAQGIVDLGKSIVINPYAISCDQTPISFFQKIADSLVKYGFSVFCSAVGNQTPLNGTIRVDLPLNEIFTLCNVCGMLIGARSGFMDMMAFTDADIICISNENYEFADLFQLEKCWSQNPKIKTIYFNVSDEDMIVNQIVEHFCIVFEKKNKIQDVHD